MSNVQGHAAKEPMEWIQEGSVHVAIALNAFGCPAIYRIGLVAKNWRSGGITIAI